MARPTTATEVASVASRGVMPTHDDEERIDGAHREPRHRPEQQCHRQRDAAVGQQLGDDGGGKDRGRGQGQVDAALHHVVAACHDDGGEATAQDRQRHALLQDGGEVLPVQEVGRLHGQNRSSRPNSSSGPLASRK